MGDHKFVYTTGSPEHVDLKTLPQRMQEGITIAKGLLEESENEQVLSHLCIFKEDGDNRVLVFESAHGLDTFLVGIGEMVRQRGISPIAELMLISEAWHASLTPPVAIKDQQEAEQWVLAERNRLNDIHGTMKDWPINMRDECVALCYVTRTTMWMAQIPFLRDGKTVLMHLDRISAFECEDIHGTTSCRLRALIPIKKEPHGDQGPPASHPQAP